jgi:hypothetical protein
MFVSKYNSSASPGYIRINACPVRALVIQALQIITHIYSCYRAMTATLASRLILNLRGSVLRSSYTEEHTPEVDVLVFSSQLLDQTTTSTYSMQDIEDPEGAVKRRDRRLIMPQRTNNVSVSLSDTVS